MTISREEALCYEIGASSWWVRHISYPPLQRLVGRYFARKVRRKWARCETQARRWAVAQLFIEIQAASRGADETRQPEEQAT
jgi:hypothetical protein